MKHKLIGKMYGILLELEEEYKEKSIKEDLYTFSRIRCDELFWQAFEWLVDDEI